MENTLASLEAIETLLNSAEEQIEAIDLDGAEEVLARCVQLGKRRELLSESLREKSRLLVSELLNVHFHLTKVTKKRTSNLSLITFGRYSILHPGSSKFGYLLDDGRKINISPIGWARENLLLWELARALLAEIKELLDEIASDPVLKSDVVAYNELVRLVSDLTTHIQDAPEPPG